ncbi:MAG: hypothetical protein O2854_00435 [Chloroflexi bacterium]|nr:hypothetical protein [Chloroflexota bacterium]
MKWFIAPTVLVIVAACSSPAALPATATPERTETVRLTPEEVPPIRGPKSPNGYQVILGTPDLGLGANRIGFVVTSPKGFVKQDVVEVTSLYVPGESAGGEVRQTATADFHLWPYGSRGLYVTELDFDRAGIWRLDVILEIGDGQTETMQVVFDVLDDPYAPEVGEKAPASDSKTAADVARLSQLTTGSLQDADLYQLSLAQAVANGLPTVVVFASPAFCITEVCGPQVEVLQELKNKYGDRANFVHVDFYDNPEEIQGNLANAQLSSAVIEWRLPSIEWSFVIDSDGVIAGRFEAFATVEELEEALLDVL